MEKLSYDKSAVLDIVEISDTDISTAYRQSSESQQNIEVRFYT